MNFIKNIIEFFKRLFNKEDNIKMIDSPVDNLQREDKEKFVNSVKVNTIENREKKNVETLTCFGDGLGIQTKVSD